MRKIDDCRQSYTIKEEIGCEIGFENILCVFEDEKDTVEMWRKNGVMCYQPNFTDYFEGNADEKD